MKINWIIIFFKKINNNKTSPYGAKPVSKQNQDITLSCFCFVQTRPASTDATDAKVLELKHIFFFSFPTGKTNEHFPLNNWDINSVKGQNTL